MIKGTLINFEGIDGSGKSRQCHLLFNRLFDVERSNVIIVGEKCSSQLIDEMRSIRLNPEYSEMHEHTELLLATASHAQRYFQFIAPALNEEKIVIVDRYIDSSIVYDHYANGIPMEKVKKISEYTTNGRTPDLTFLLDLPVEMGLGRKQKLDRMEQKGIDYHKRVRNGYLSHAKNEWKRFRVIDATKTEQEISDQIWKHVSKYLESDHRQLT